MSIGTRSHKITTVPTDTPEYWRGFRENVFKLIKMSYDFLIPTQYKNSDEPDISGEFVKKMKEITQSDTAPRWASRFSIHDDPPINEPRRLGKNRRRVDIELVTENTRVILLRPKGFLEIRSMLANILEVKGLENLFQAITLMIRMRQECWVMCSQILWKYGLPS